MSSAIDYNAMKKADLIALLKQKGATGISNKNKSDLVEMLVTGQIKAAGTPGRHKSEGPTVESYKAQLKAMGISGYSNKNKEQLKQMVSDAQAGLIQPGPPRHGPRPKSPSGASRVVSPTARVSPTRRAPSPVRPPVVPISMARSPSPTGMRPPVPIPVTRITSPGNVSPSRTLPVIRPIAAGTALPRPPSPRTGAASVAPSTRPASPRSRYNAMNLTQLRDEARLRKLRGFSQMNKAALINALLQ